MTLIIRYITSAILSVVALAMLTVLSSCRHDDRGIVVPGEDVKDPRAVFTITLDDGAHVHDYLSRATPSDGEYEAGSGLENYIDIEGYDYTCYLFTAADVLMSKLAVTSMIRVDNGSAGRSYTVTASLRPFEVDVIEGGCKVAILANWSTYPAVEPGVTTVADLCAAAEARMAYSADRACLGAGNLIPMYGIKTFEAASAADDDNTFRIGTVRLLRAYAKVEVNVLFANFGDDIPPALTSVVLTNCYNAGYKMQAAQYAGVESDYVHGSWYADYTPVHIPADASAMSLPLVKDESTGAYVAYVPEYDNLGADGTPRVAGDRARIQISFVTNGTDAHEGYVDFRQSGSYVDLARDNIYRFNVTVRSKSEIEGVLDVIPFSGVDLRPGYGVDRERLSGYSPIYAADGSIDHWCDKWGNAWYLGNTAGDLYATVNGEICLFVYTYPERKLSHWFDSEGNQHSFAAMEMTNNQYAPIDIDGNGYPDWYLDENNRRVWLTPFRDAGWWSPYNSTYVWILENYWDSANHTPEYWYDFQGKRHSMDEDEATVLADWINFMN